MKALTVRQPWAWAIIHGGKNVENRTQAWSYRGPLAIHAGAAMSQRGLSSPLVINAWLANASRELGTGGPETPLGVIIGVVELVGVHVAMPGCCESPWGEQQYVEAGGKVRRQLVHLELEDPRPVEPIPCTGRLGLWTPPADVLEQLGGAS